PAPFPVPPAPGAGRPALVPAAAEIALRAPGTRVASTGTPTSRRSGMDESRARELVRAERAEVEGLLAAAGSEGDEDREAEDEQDADIADPAQSLTAEGIDDAITESLRARLAAVERAEQRLANGTYGKSVR